MANSIATAEEESIDREDELPIQTEPIATATKGPAVRNANDQPVAATRPALFACSSCCWLPAATVMSAPAYTSHCFAQECCPTSRGNLLVPYEQRVANLEAEQVQTSKTPDYYSGRFRALVDRPLERLARDSTRPITVDIQGLVLGAMQHSPKIKAISSVPEIHRTAIIEADATFATAQAFAESKLIDTNDPVGNTLTTGGPTRYFDQNVYSDAGVRKKTLWGGQLEVSQRLGYENSNSTYFIPPYQATAKLFASYTQPLLRGAAGLITRALWYWRKSTQACRSTSSPACSRTISWKCIARIGICTWNAWPTCKSAGSARTPKRCSPTCGLGSDWTPRARRWRERRRPWRCACQPGPRRDVRAECRSEGPTARE